jgi:hypothetical protein
MQVWRGWILNSGSMMILSTLAYGALFFADTHLFLSVFSNWCIDTLLKQNPSHPPVVSTSDKFYTKLWYVFPPAQFLPIYDSFQWTRRRPSSCGTLLQKYRYCSARICCLPCQLEQVCESSPSVIFFIFSHPSETIGFLQSSYTLEEPSSLMVHQCIYIFLPSPLFFTG